MARKRHQRVRRERIYPWPESHPLPEEVASKAIYIGSNEHKDYHSSAGPPALRSDAARCDSRYSEFESITEALRQAIRRGCSGAQFEGNFPRYVWGWFDDCIYEARLINREQGWYKAWPIEQAEWPRDDEQRLDRVNYDAPLQD